ncbi:MAG: hypothetical protein KDK70_28730 [Myxococcales bacterium]|nr:hypothetical protein [Myxococcales bacterium]
MRTLAIVEEARMPSFDPSRYTTVPSRSPAAMLSLARALLAAADPAPSEVVASRLDRLRAATDELQAAWVEVSRPEVPAENPQPYDLALDRAWGSLRARLAAWEQLDRPPGAGPAQELRALLFPTGLDFLQLPYAEQWAQSERRLALVDADGLAESIDALAGPQFLLAVRQAQADYGRVLGITDAKPAQPDAARVLEPVREVRAAIASYARAVVGLTDEVDDEAVAAMQQQLRPLVDARRPRAATPEGDDLGDDLGDDPSEDLDAPLDSLDPLDMASEAPPVAVPAAQ